MGGETQDREFARHVALRNSLAEIAARLFPNVRCVRPRAEHHRATDWRQSPDHPWICGLCHPPAIDDIERRAQKTHEQPGAGNQ